MTDTPAAPAVDAEREGLPYQPPQPFLREHKRAPMVSRDGLQAWLTDQIAYLESIDRTEHGDGAFAALKSVARETVDIPDHTTLTTRAERAEADNARLRAVNAGLREAQVANIAELEDALKARLWIPDAPFGGLDAWENRRQIADKRLARARAALSSEPQAAAEGGRG